GATEIVEVHIRRTPTAPQEEAQVPSTLHGVILGAELGRGCLHECELEELDRPRLNADIVSVRALRPRAAPTPLALNCPHLLRMPHIDRNCQINGLLLPTHAGGLRSSR